MTQAPVIKAPVIQAPVNQAPGLSRLLLWLSPAFPTGAFSHSHGLEWAVEVGEVVSAPTLLGWIRDLAAHGALRSDAILLCHAHRRAEAGDRRGLADLAELAGALNPCRERRVETLSQGRAFAIAACAAWDLPQLKALTVEAGPASLSHPVAIGAATGECGLALEPAAAAFCHAWAGNLVSAAVRLVPLGQSAGLSVMAALEAELDLLAADALALDLDDLGGAAFRSDLAAMLHETQLTRLFRT